MCHHMRGDKVRKKKRKPETVKGKLSFVTYHLSIVYLSLKIKPSEQFLVKQIRQLQNHKT